MVANIISIKQLEDFPELVNIYILEEPGKNAISLYSYKNNVCYTQVGKNKYMYTPFYVGVVPRCIGEEHAVMAFLYSNLKMPTNSIIKAVPLYFVKFVLETVIDVIVFKLPDEKIEVLPDDIKYFLKGFFELEEEGIIIESEYKAKAFLIHAHKHYEKI